MLKKVSILYCKKGWMAWILDFLQK